MSYLFSPIKKKIVVRLLVVALGDSALSFIEQGIPCIDLLDALRHAALLGASVGIRLEAIEIFLQAQPVFATTAAIAELGELSGSAVDGEEVLQLLKLMESYPQPEFAVVLTELLALLPDGSAVYQSAVAAGDSVDQTWGN